MNSKTTNAIRTTIPSGTWAGKDTTAGKWRGIASGLDEGGRFRIFCTTPPLYDTRDAAKTAICEILTEAHRGNA